MPTNSRVDQSIFVAIIASMLKIRLLRVGRKHDPSYRVVVLDSKKAPQTGSYVENLGFYDPRKDKYELKNERVKYWISTGAQISDTVRNLLITAKIISGQKKNVTSKKKGGSEKTPAEEAKPAEEPKTEQAEKS